MSINIRRRHHGAAAALCGPLAGAAALGAAEPVAAFLSRPQAGPLVTVGSAFIDLTPAWLKDFAIRTFGTADKLVLLLVLGAGVVAVTVVAGLLAPRRPRTAVLIVAALGLIAAAIAPTRPTGVWRDALPGLVAALVGAAALHLLARTLPVPGTPSPPAVEGTVAAAPERAPATVSGAVTSWPAVPTMLAPGTRTADRRSFLRAGAGTLGFAVTGTITGRLATGAGDAAAVGTGLVLPAPADPAPSLPGGSDLHLPGLSSFTTPNDRFYRVDTALVVPRVPHDTWRLRIHGLVDRPVELTFADLLAQPLVERDITLTCVSNEVGGPYAGHARWLGVDLAALLRRAGVRAGADQILSRSADGWTCGTPVQAVLDGRDALLAIGMNGLVLPAVHGFPARLVVPGLYGYVSATKWVTEIKLTRFADEQAYWTRRGWAIDAPVKTSSRIEIPRPFARLPAGRTVIAGVAWAQHRGVAAVEVRVDDGPWRPARLAAAPSPDTWRQWHLDWDAAPGDHRLQVRATDATGHTQTSDRVPPFPEGATGRHTVAVTVR